MVYYRWRYKNPACEHKILQPGHTMQEEKRSLCYFDAASANYSVWSDTEQDRTM